MTLKALQIIHAKDRILSIDIFRAIAIIIVILFHWKKQKLLPFGFYGVDLFFVISGILVGGLLTKIYKKNEKINFKYFILQRGLKIWPSYFTFIFLGNFIVSYIIEDKKFNQSISLSDYPRYIFFCMNYVRGNYHEIFDVVWSLCVEEHFYVILPVGMLLLQKYRNSNYALFSSVIIVILTGIILKFPTIYLHKSVYYGTHTRIDALGWGVLLNLIIQYYPNFLKKVTTKILALLIGSSILFSVILLIPTPIVPRSNQEIIAHTFTPFAFFLMIMGSYYINFSRLKFLSFISYYSYNWYLWHILVMIIVVNYLGSNSVLAIVVYLVSSFLIAMLFTIIVEEPFLQLRKRYLNKKFQATESN